MNTPIDTAWRVLSYVLWMLPGMALAMGLYLSVLPWRKHRLRGRGLSGGGAREAGLLLLFLFSGGMALLTLCPQPSWLYDGLLGYWTPYFDTRALPLTNRVNFIPFSQGDSLFNIVGNVVMFAPFGFFAALLWRGWSWRRALGTGFAITASIECWQLLIGRYFDIDDIILNTLGVLCGYGLWRLVKRTAPGFAEKFHVYIGNEETR